MSTPSVIKYIDAAIMVRRIRDIYDFMLRGEYQKAKHSIVEFYISLMRAIEIDFDRVIYNKIFDEFAHIKIAASLNNFNDVHNRIRNLHYDLIFKNNMYNKMNTFVIDRDVPVEW